MLWRLPNMFIYCKHQFGLYHNCAAASEQSGEGLGLKSPLLGQSVLLACTLTSEFSWPLIRASMNCYFTSALRSPGSSLGPFKAFCQLTLSQRKCNHELCLQRVPETLENHFTHLSFNNLSNVPNMLCPFVPHIKIPVFLTPLFFYTPTLIL